MAKRRIPIPEDVAARVLFRSDRRCCVCRVAGKPVQIHHIDEDPSNNDPANLAVLCLDCHRDTQLRGGFDRKLDAEQVRIYRDDWERVVEESRAEGKRLSEERASPATKTRLAVGVAEILREKEQWWRLAVHYSIYGDDELRDKYIEKAIDEGVTDDTHCYLRGIQGRPDLIPVDVVECEIARLEGSDDHFQLARLLVRLERPIEATRAYLTGILESLDTEGRTPFSAAFYLKELAESGLIDELFIEALAEFTRDDDLWWQVRSLQELGWTDELRERVLAAEEEIENGDNMALMIELAKARDDEKAFVEAVKEFERGVTTSPFSVENSDDDSDQE